MTGLKLSECQLFAHHLSEVWAVFYRLEGAPPEVTEGMKDSMKKLGERECARELLIAMFIFALEQLGASDKLLDSLTDSAEKGSLGGTNVVLVNDEWTEKEAPS